MIELKTRKSAQIRIWPLLVRKKTLIEAHKGFVALWSGQGAGFILFLLLGCFVEIFLFVWEGATKRSDNLYGCNSNFYLRV